MAMGRMWLYVIDHCEAIHLVLQKGSLGETYNIGGQSERQTSKSFLKSALFFPKFIPGRNYQSLIQIVQDRPGHDRRYAIDISNIQREIGWSPRETFTTGLRKTIAWFLENPSWVESVTSGSYREWIDFHYAGRGQ